MNNTRLAVFAASLQCTDKMKVMPRGTPKSRSSMTWGIWWLASSAEKDGGRGGKFPTVRHGHLLELIGWSHSHAQAQAEEREERRWLDWDCGNTIITSSAKRKAQSPRVAGRSFIYNRKSNGAISEPWGTQVTQGASSGCTSSIWTWYDPSER